MTKEEARETIIEAARRSRQNDLDDTNEWGRPRPTRVDWDSINRRMPKHKHCTRVIAGSRNTAPNTCIGLYCKEHGKLYQWINYEQAEWLLSIGVDVDF